MSEVIQQYYSEAFDCGQIKRIEVLPIVLNSIDILKMKEINDDICNATKCNSNNNSNNSLTQEINEHVMRTMFYSNENYYQVMT
jgi:hypothetical protein